MSENTCPFCVPRKHDWLKKWGVASELANARLVESDHLVATPDLLPINSLFHVLIKSIDHKYAFASSPELDRELRLLLEILTWRTGEKLIIAEHGGVEGQTASSIQSIHHRHMHILPATVDAVSIVESELTKQGIASGRKKVESLSPLSNKVLTNTRIGYLYLQDNMSKECLLAPDLEGNFPSQITQKNLALAYTNKFHNWKDLQHSDALQQIAAQRIM